jgi:hypothetical protein
VDTQIVIGPNGQGRCVYTEAMDLSQLGELQIRRASFVEPDDLGLWWAELSPVNGPRIGPFGRRVQALEAEQAWLERHWLGERDRP